MVKLKKSPKFVNKEFYVVEFVPNTIFKFSKDNYWKELKSNKMVSLPIDNMES